MNEKMAMSEHNITPQDVVFDLGGVVFRWEPLVLLQQLFAQERWPLQGQPVFIDDVQRNIDAAHQHGWRGILFESPEQVRADLVAQKYLRA